MALGVVSIRKTGFAFVFFYKVVYTYDSFVRLYYTHPCMYFVPGMYSYVDVFRCAGHSTCPCFWRGGVLTSLFPSEGCCV